MRGDIIKSNLVILLFFNLLFSLYQWQAYTYWLKSSIDNMHSCEEMYKDKSLEKYKDENAKNIELWRGRSEIHARCKTEWLLKFSADSLVLLLAIYWMRKPKQTIKNLN